MKIVWPGLATRSATKTGRSMREKEANVSDIHQIPCAALLRLVQTSNLDFDLGIRL